MLRPRTGLLATALCVMAAPVSAGDEPAPLADPGQKVDAAASEARDTPQPPPANPDLFGTKTVAVKGGSADDQWARAPAPAGAAWLMGLTAAARGLGPKQQAMFVQAAVNRRLAYRADADNWGAADYWATAEETIARRSGDCEDMAIVKMQALRLLGFDPRDLYLVTGRNRAGAQHALLAVRIDGVFWVLDDGSATVVPAAGYGGLTPMITYGAGWKWVHGYEVPPHEAVAALRTGGTAR